MRTLSLPRPLTGAFPKRQVPEANVGAVLSDMNSNRRGEIGDLESLPDGRRVVKGQVPLESMVGYATDVRSLTGGQASFHMSFSRFAKAR